MIRFSIIATLLVLAAAPASASSRTQAYAPGTCPVALTLPWADPALLPDGLVNGLLDWIETETDYDVSPVRADPPAVTFCETGQAIPYENAEVLIGEDIYGIYDSLRRQVILRLPWSAEDPRDRGVLLHELVHRVQLANGDWDCLNAPEWEAYTLQARYLEAHGIDPGFDWLHIYSLSRCQRDIHPAAGD